MKKIPLTQGKFALVDDEDFDWLNQWKWYANHAGSKSYAIRNSKRNEHPTKQLMHRVIMNAPKGVEIDHINGDGFDNRRENLRTCSHKENATNRGKQDNNGSGYKGVSLCPFKDKQGNQKFQSQIYVDGKSIYLGLFVDPIEAAHAYDEAAKKYFGDFAALNFSEANQ